nr:MAG TPA: hypothetical protein [Caudoviricetes sp.]
MPIIDPMYLYLIEVLHNIDVLNQGLLIILTVVICGFCAIWLADAEVRELSKLHKGKVIALCIAFVISALIAVLVPTKDAMYKMLLAHYVTTDNIQLVNDAIKVNVQDYLNMLGETVKNLR